MGVYPSLFFIFLAYRAALLHVYLFFWVHFGMLYNLYCCTHIHFFFFFFFSYALFSLMKRCALVTQLFIFLLIFLLPRNCFQRQPWLMKKKRGNVTRPPRTTSHFEIPPLIFKNSQFNPPNFQFLSISPPPSISIVKLRRCRTHVTCV
jgi:hypothetical protein